MHSTLSLLDCVRYRVSFDLYCTAQFSRSAGRARVVHVEAPEHLLEGSKPTIASIAQMVASKHP